MQVSVLNMAGETVGQVELVDTIFSAPVNGPLMQPAFALRLTPRIRASRWLGRQFDPKPLLC